MKDTLVAVAVAVATTAALLVDNDPTDRAPDIWAYLLIAAAAGLLVFRRRWPVGTLATVTIVVFAYLGLDYASGPITFTLLVAFYSAAAAGHRGPAMAAALIFAGGGLAWRVLAEGDDFVGVLLHSALFVLASLLGDGVHGRRISQRAGNLAADDDASERAVRERIEAVLTRQDFHPVFQPIYTLDYGRLVAVEALTRFDAEPSQPPNVWFEQAAKVGFGPELELAAIEAALTASADLAPGIAVSVNTSPQTLADPRLVSLLDRHRERPLIVEVTEHAIVDDYDRLDVVRERLRMRGIQLAVDDAGAGFASLQHIVELAPDIIKLDPGLTRNVHLDPVRQALADSLIQFARRTGTQLVAEGIEEVVDLCAWRDLGANAAQGYLLARPGPLPPPDQFEFPPADGLRRLQSSGKASRADQT